MIDYKQRKDVFLFNKNFKKTPSRSTRLLFDFTLLMKYSMVKKLLA